MMNGFPPLLAAGDWVQLLFIFIFVIVPVLSKFFGKEDAKKPAQRKVQRPPQQIPGAQPGAPQQQRLPQQQPRGQQGAPVAKNALEQEIESFLNRSRGKSAKPAPVERATPQPEKAVRRLSEKPRSIKQRTVSDHQHESVSDHVDRHIKSHPVSEHSQELGKRIGQSDEAMEDHLHDVFDHSIGSLSHEQASRQVSEGTDAAIWETAESKRRKRSEARDGRSESIAQMLRNKDSIRQAIILGEVLKRPDFD